MFALDSFVAQRENTLFRRYRHFENQWPVGHTRVVCSFDVHLSAADFSVRYTFLSVSFNTNVELVYNIAGYVRADELGRIIFAVLSLLILPCSRLSLNDPRQFPHHIGNGRDEPYDVWAQPEKGGPWRRQILLPLDERWRGATRRRPKRHPRNSTRCILIPSDEQWQRQYQPQPQ